MKRRVFTLLELILSVGILALFLLVAAETLVSTLEVKDELEFQYGHQKVKDTGWNILYQDLGFAVGIYYHHVSLWEGPPEAAPKEEKTADQKLKEKKKKKKGVTSTSDELFLFNSLPSLDDPFVEIVCAKGRMRSSGQDYGYGFRKIKYFLIANPNPNELGEVIMRTEESWKPAGGKESRSFDEEEEFNLQEDYRKYALIENLSNVSFEVYNGKEWEEEWSSLKKGDLPLALKINYDLIDEHEPLEDQTRVIPIPISYLIIEEPEEEFDF